MLLYNMSIFYQPGSPLENSVGSSHTPGSTAVTMPIIGSARNVVAGKIDQAGPTNAALTHIKESKVAM